MADAQTIHAVAECLFKAAVEGDASHISDFAFEWNPSPSPVIYGSVIVPICDLPDEVRLKIDDSVERNVIAYLDDLGILCKITNHEKWGRSFFVSTTQLAVRSWDEVLRKRGQRGGDLT